MTEAEKHARLRELDAIVSDLGRIRPMIENDGDCLDTLRQARALERGLRRFDGAVLRAYLGDVLGCDGRERRGELPVDGCASCSSDHGGWRQARSVSRGDHRLQATLLARQPWFSLATHG